MNAAAVTLDWTPILTQMLTGLAVIVVPIVGGFLAKALAALAAKWGFEGVAADKANMETEINAALKFGITAVLPLIQQKGWDSPEVRALVLSRASSYFHERFPDRSATIQSAAGPPCGRLE